MQSLAIIEKYLSKLGVEPEATRVYAKLTEVGPSSALQLAKKLSISRTQIYRHLEKLQENGLVSAESLSYGTQYRTLPLENIEGRIADREAENAALRRNLSSMSDLFKQVAAAGSGPEVKVRHYYGLAGLKQVNWNLTKAKGEYRVFEAAHLSEHLDKAFSRRCREEFVSKGIKTRDLTNKTSIKAKHIEPYNPKNSEYRYVDPEMLNIDFEIYIYNDVVTFLDYKPEKLNAIEIQHPALSKMMKQLFDAMWATAKPLEIET